MKLWLAIILSALMGVSPDNRTPPCRVVTGITVQIQSGSEVVQRHYSGQEEMTLLLDYLRGIKKANEIDAEAASLPEKRYLIQIHLSDGSTRSHYQNGIHAYGPSPDALYPIAPSHGVNLPLILAILAETSPQ